VLLDPQDPKHALVLERLVTEIPVWLTTVNAEGQPQTSPVWFWWDDGIFRLISKPDATKVTNLRGNPLVSLNLQASDTADDDVVIFEGRATFDPEVPDVETWKPYIEKYRGLIESYGWTPSSMLEEYAMAFRVTPTRVRVP
jgi:PPOX class probable F420-dependent enzyme